MEGGNLMIHRLEVLSIIYSNVKKSISCLSTLDIFPAHLIALQ